MARPKRPGWSKITITVSKAVARDIRIHAAELGIEMGTFVDRTIRDHALIPGVMEKMLANDVLEAVRQHPDPAELIGEITDEFKRGSFILERPLTPASLTRMAEAWAEAGQIPQPWKWVMYFVFVQGVWDPTPVKQGMLKGFDWFKR